MLIEVDPAMRSPPSRASWSHTSGRDRRALLMGVRDAPRAVTEREVANARSACIGLRTKRVAGRIVAPAAHRLRVTSAE